MVVVWDRVHEIEARPSTPSGLLTNVTWRQNDTVSGTEGVQAVNVVLFAVLCVVFVVSLTGNTLVFLVIINTRSLRRLNNILILSLAAADLFNIVVVLPLFLLNGLSGRWDLPVLLCPVYHVFHVSCEMVVVYTLMAIGLERVFIITRPLVYQRTITAVRLGISIGAIWVVSFTYGLLQLLWFRNTPDNHRGGVHAFRDHACYQRNGVCDYKPTFGYAIFDFVLMFSLPLVVMLMCYGRIFCVVQSQINRIAPTSSILVDNSEMPTYHAERSWLPSSAYSRSTPSDPHSGIYVISAARQGPCAQPNDCHLEQRMKREPKARTHHHKQDNSPDTPIINNDENLNSNGQTGDIQPNTSTNMNGDYGSHDVTRQLTPCRLRAHLCRSSSNEQLDAKSRRDDLAIEVTPSSVIGSREELYENPSRRLSEMTNPPHHTRSSYLLPPLSQTHRDVHGRSRSNPELKPLKQNHSVQLHSALKQRHSRVRQDSLGKSRNYSQQKRGSVTFKLESEGASRSNSPPRRTTLSKVCIVCADDGDTGGSTSEATMSTDISLATDASFPADASLTTDAPLTTDTSLTTAAPLTKAAPIRTSRTWPHIASSHLTPPSQTPITHMMPHLQRQNTTSTASIATSTSSRTRNRLFRLTENKAIKMTSVIVGTFVLCWMPYEVCFLMRRLDPLSVPQLAWDIVNATVFLSSAINPFVYNFYSTEFRRALKIFVTCRDKTNIPWA